MDHPKEKLSITLSPDVVRSVDRAVRSGAGKNRSSVIEAWLRQASRLDAEERLRQETIAYYQSLSRAEQDENRDMARASGHAARRLSIDED